MAKTTETKLIVREKAELKIRIAMEAMKSYEVSWFGKIKEKDGKFFLEDIYIPPQENETAYTTTDDEKYPKWFHDTIIKRGIQNQIRLHGHTHPNFSTFSSGTDTKQFKELLKEVDDYFIQMILSNKDEPYVTLWRKKNEKEAVIENVDLIWEYTQKFTKVVENMTQILPKVKQISIFDGYTDEFDRLERFDEDNLGYDEEFEETLKEEGLVPDGHPETQ